MADDDLDLDALLALQEQEEQAMDDQDQEEDMEVLREWEQQEGPGEAKENNLRARKALFHSILR